MTTANRTDQTILTLNAGSSSLKIGVFTPDLDRLATGLVERIGSPEGNMRLKDADGADLPLPGGLVQDYATHAASLATTLGALQVLFPGRTVSAVGHRVVHGGVSFHKPTRLNPAVMAEIERLAPYAPLHQPHNIAGIKGAMQEFPDAVQIACFDTAFHRGHPYVNDTFGLPHELYDRGVRRYGFHGLSYDFISGKLREIAPDLARGRVIVCHLGNGASMCAIRDGHSIDSTMGFSAVDGLPMGTRSGQLDPGVIFYLMDQQGMTKEDVSDLLYKKSGLLGLSGISNDMRTLMHSNDPNARNAIDYFVHSIQKELGALTASLGGLDAVVFTGGIGEHAAPVRAQVADTMGWLGIAVDPARNAANATVISPDGAKVTVMVIPTDEEGVIARATVDYMKGRGQ